MQINVAVTDANNIVCQVVPPQTEVITIDRGVAGNGIVSIVPVTISTFQYLRITYTNGTVQDVGPLTSTAYTATAPITIVGNTISLATVPIASGGTDATTAAGAIQNLLPSYTGNANKRLGLNSTATGLEWVLDGGGTVTSIAASGGTTGLTFSGSPITTSGTLTLGGTLGVANGGTGATTAGDALTNLGAIGAITSTDGSVTITSTGTSRDLSVAVAAATNNVIAQVRNTTGATLAKGTVVYISGATGQVPTVSKAIATGDATSAQTLGMITADLPNNSNGNVTIIGLITNIDTSAYTDGAQLYLSGTTAGAVTATKPYAPIHLVYVAVVEYAHPTQGKLFVKVQNGYELDEIHDVSIVSPVTGQTLVYNSTTDLWVNNTVSLTAGVNGTLPIANGGTGQTTANAAFNALAPSQTGNSGKYLTTDGTNTSWATNPLGTVTSVAATVPTFLSVSGSPITTSGTLAFTLSGTALPTTSGGTGLTSFLANGVVYALSTSALTTNVNFYFDGSQFVVNNSSATTGPTVSSFAINGNGGNNFAASFSAIGETYSINNASAKYQYFQAGTVASISATSNGVNSGALIDFNAYNASLGATGVFLGAVAGPTANGAANFVIGRRTAATNWAESLRVDTSGNVGIGTNSPTFVSGQSGLQLSRSANAVMRITDTTASANFDLLQAGQDSYVFGRGTGSLIFGTNGTEKAKIDGSGNFGIGTSSPDAKLQVVGTSFFGADGAYSAVGSPKVVVYGAGATETSILWFEGGVGSALAGFVASDSTFYITNTYAGNALGSNGIAINQTGSVGIGATSPVAKLDVYQATAGSNAARFAHVNGNGIYLNPSYNYYDAYNHIFRSLNGTTTYATIDNNGNLGLGTNTPLYKLQVGGLGAGVQSGVYVPAYFNWDGAYLQQATSGGRGAALTLASHVNVSQSSAYRISADNDSASRALVFSYAADSASYSGATFTERARITSSGSLLVGTTSAFNGELLQVSRAGTVSTTDFIYTSAPTALIQTPNNGVDNKAVLMLRAAFTDGSFSAGSISVKSATQYRGEMVLTYDADSSGGFLAFNQFIPTSATTAERARFNPNGYLGIGTSNPNTKLDIRGTSNTAESTIQVVGNSVSTLLLGQNADGGVVRAQGGNNTLTFWTGGSADTGAGQSGSERARITSSGLSIGSTALAPSGGGLRVQGAINPISGIVSTNLIAGYVASNYSGTRYWLLHIMQTGAGVEQSAFNCMGDVHASSYTTWNLCNLWIRREYASVNVYAGITGVIKSAVTVSVVDITYSNVRYVAIKFAGGDPGIEANLVGYLMNQMYTNGTDASFINGTSGVTENAVIASY